MRGLRIGFGGIALLAGLAVLVLTSTEPVGASTRLCRQLEAELVSAGNGGGGARARKYDDAIDRQREQMAIARAQAKDAGCGFALLGRSVRQCAALNAMIDRMGRNLDTLQQQRDRMGSGGSGKRSRAKVLAALEANGCRDEAVAERPRIEEPRQALADPGDDGRARTPLELMLEEGGPEEQPDEAPRARAGETYQTMCVRTCDGYFFPISYASTVTDFDRDQKNCETSCPGTEMQVFFGPSGIDEPANMVSTETGRFYTELPTAFLHQQANVPEPVGCGCNPKKDFKVIAGTPPPQVMSRPVETVVPQEGAVEGGDAESTALPTPAPKPDVSAAPSVAATPPGETTPPFQMPPPDAPESSIVAIPLPAAPKDPPPAATRPTDAARDKPAKPENPAERKVRVVGPAFLPDPEAVAVPQVPDPTPAP